MRWKVGVMDKRGEIYWSTFAMIFSAITRSIIVFLFVFCLLGSAIRADAQSQKLTILDFSDSKILAPNAVGEVKFDFGIVKQGLALSLHHSFALRNDGALPITIVHILSSCDCVGIIPTDHVHFPLTLNSGQSAVYSVSINTFTLMPGAFTKLVQIDINQQPSTSMRICLTGTFMTGVNYREPDIDFGNIVYGSKATKRLTAIMDKRIVPDPDRLTIESSNPNISLVLLSSVPRRSNTQVLIYSATLVSNPKLGLLNGVIFFKGPSLSGKSIMWGPSVGIKGNVVGNSK